MPLPALGIEEEQSDTSATLTTSLRLPAMLSGPESVLLAAALNKKTPPCRAPQSFEPAFAGGSPPGRSALPERLPHSCPRDRFPLYRYWLKTPLRRSRAQQGYSYYTTFCPVCKSGVCPRMEQMKALGGTVISLAPERRWRNQPQSGSYPDRPTDAVAAGAVVTSSRCDCQPTTWRCVGAAMWTSPLIWPNR